ncbi:MAG: 2-hydroxyacyl-CoA dehydratase [Candidatus Tectomicrobia bacterium]|uniref:2-hydroxyacyl-CoA dehydratase n=1 Tax=Tectimicrobiota bacterium TaxID=2528274 RepID=A0A932FW48_UNCTE|nr:2-hydroxyacyl-CoA dehydratase [Candidatus Tectomicrobia bacterium]
MHSSAIGSRKIGYSCSYAPLEVLDAFGLIPMRTFGSPSAPNVCDAYIHNNFCGYTKNVINTYQGQDMLFVDTCCQMKRVHDAWKESFDGLSYLLNLPRTNTAESRRFWVDSLKDMISYLEGSLGVRFDSRRLNQAIQRRNTLRASLRRVEELLLQNQIPSHRYLELVHQIQEEGVEEAIARVDSFLKEQEAAPWRSDLPVPILVTGSIIAALPLAKTVEEMGGNVVYFDTCCTSRWYCQKISEGTEPFEALAAGYLGQIPCPRMNQSFERFALLRQIIRERQVKGVIHHMLKFCDPFIYEAHPFKLSLEEEGLPLLRIESDYDFGVSGQISTRIHAFMEMI